MKLPQSLSQALCFQRIFLRIQSNSLYQTVEWQAPVLQFRLAQNRQTSEVRPVCFPAAQSVWAVLLSLGIRSALVAQSAVRYPQALRCPPYCRCRQGSLCFPFLFLLQSRSCFPYPVGSAALSVTVAVILLSVLTAPLSVLSFVLSAAHPARLSVISPARRTASIFPVLNDITSIYRIPIIREKSSTFYKLRKQVTLTARKQVLRLHRVLRIQFAIQPALVPFSAHRHQEHIR